MAQLQCPTPIEADTLIRKVSFEGNSTFTDADLALHVVSTETDITRRLFDRRWMIPTFTALGVVVAIQSGKDKWERERNTAYLGGVGFLLGYALGQISGVPRCLQPGTLSGDIINLGSFYRDQGFIDVRVDTATSIHGRWVDVLFKVTEGAPVLVDSLAVIGFDTTRMGALPSQLKSQKGGRYSPSLTQQDVDSIETRLRNIGYPDGRVLRQVDVNPASKRATVQFTVEPGPRARIGNIRVRRSALVDSTPSVEEGVIRGLLRFGPGDLYNASALFETERRFYRAGTFVSAEVAPDLSHVRQDSLVDVTVTVVEDLTHTVSIEPGIGTLDCIRLRAEYTDRAFLGGINRLDLSGSASKIGLAPRIGAANNFCHLFQDNSAEGDISSRQMNYNATVRASRPLPLPGGLLPSASLYTERRGGYKAYLRTTLIGGAVTLSKGITRSIVFEGSYNLEYGHTEAAEPVLCFLFRACDASSRAQQTGDKPLAVLGARFSRDRRNFIDSTSSGTVVRLDLRGSHPALLSDKTLRFAKGVIDASWYTRLFGGGVLAARVRAGLIGFADASNGTSLPPPQERLFAGGETSVRGYRQNELGPVIYITTSSDSMAIDAISKAPSDSALQTLDMRTIPVGGNAMYVGNLEYRVPTQSVAGFRIQEIVFVDVGTVQTSTAFRSLAGSGQFRWTPGVALKYFSPVGPVQLNLAYNKYDAFSGPVYTDRLNSQALTCISGVDSSGACQSANAVRPRARFGRLSLSISFPPDW